MQAIKQFTGGIVMVVAVASLARCVGLDFHDDPSLSSGDCQLAGIVAKTSFSTKKGVEDSCYLVVRNGSFREGSNKDCYVNGYNLAGSASDAGCNVFIPKSMWASYRERVKTLAFPEGSVLGQSTTVDTSTKSLRHQHYPNFKYTIVYDGPAGDASTLYELIRTAAQEAHQRAIYVEGGGLEPAYSLELAAFDKQSSALLCTLEVDKNRLVAAQKENLNCDSTTMRFWRAQHEVVLKLIPAQRREIYARAADLIGNDAARTRAVTSRKAPNASREQEAAHSAIMRMTVPLKPPQLETQLLDEFKIDRLQLEYVLAEGRILWTSQEPHKSR